MQSSTFVALSLGANLGDKYQTLHAAFSMLSEIVEDIQSSSIYETEPVGYQDQPAFYNCIFTGNTSLTVEDLHARIKSIEVALGRQQRPQWHEREIDIDIVLFGSSIIQNEKLTIPHPRMHERLFVLKPLAELCPDMQHPLLQQSVQQLIAVCPDTSGISTAFPPFEARG